MNTNTLKYWYKVTESFLEDLGSRHLFLISAGIAFNALLCVFPLLLVALFIVGNLVNIDAFLPSLEIFLSTLLPMGESGTGAVSLILKEITSLFSHSSNAGWIGIPALLWTASALLSSFRSGMEAVFGTITQQSFVHVKVRDLWGTIVFIFLLIASTFLHPIASAFEGILFPILPDGLFITGIMVRIVAFLSPPMLFMFMYRTLPPKRLPWNMIRKATFLAWLLWESARMLFSWYVGKTPGFGIFYGTYAVLVIPAVWTYYTAVITLLSAELAKRHSLKNP
ncbi:MAG: YihY/virulence factor BrkB family protein [Ignavibacteria bacterium]